MTEHEKDQQAAEYLERRRQEHALLSEQDRLENALAIWIRDMRDEQLALVKKGGRLSVPALAYEEVLKLREILGRFMVDRKRRIQGRWDRRKERRLLAAYFPKECPGDPAQCLCDAHYTAREQSKYAGLTRRERRAISRKEWLLRHG